MDQHTTCVVMNCVLAVWVQQYDVHQSVHCTYIIPCTRALSLAACTKMRDRHYIMPLQINTLDRFQGPSGTQSIRTSAEYAQSITSPTLTYPVAHKKHAHDWRNSSKICTGTVAKETKVCTPF